MNNFYKNNPGLAAVLSFIFSGLGQIYNGELIKGLIIISFSFLSIVLTILGAIFLGYYLLGRIKEVILIWLGTGLFVLGIFLICIIGIYSIVDAYKISKIKK